MKEKIINRIVNKFEDIRNQFETLCLNLILPVFFITYKKNRGTNHTPRKEHIIISLTSYPGRMDKINLCLETLLRQEVKPDKIILYLVEEECREWKISPNLKELLDCGVELKYVSQNLMPHNKYFYAMQEYKDSIIITVDDDCFYSKKLVKDLMKGYYLHSKDIICTRAHRIIVQNNTILPYAKWQYEIKDATESSLLLLATGVGGVLYPPDCLPMEAFDSDAIIRKCLKADDIWLKAMEVLNGRKVFCIKNRRHPYNYGINNTQKTSLVSSNVGQGGNDRYIQVVFSEYGILKQLLDSQSNN